jgi:hypothetical protein
VTARVVVDVSGVVDPALRRFFLNVLERSKESLVQKPSKGRTVIAHVDKTQNNGSDEAPAVITRVWGEHPDGGWTVNLRVLQDSSAMPLSLTSVRLLDEKPTVDGTVIGRAWWPPRV